jgi:hypothetical protein
MEQFISQLSVSFPNNNKSIFTGIPIKFNLFISNNIIIRDKVNYIRRRNPQYYSIGDRFLSVLHSRMRNKYSALNADLYHANLIVNYNCLCGYFNENAEHYLFLCKRFTLSRFLIVRSKEFHA